MSLSESMLDEFRKRKGARVIMNDAVVSVSDTNANDATQQQTTRKPIIVKLKSGATIKCRYVIAALSPQLCSKIEFDVRQICV